MGSSTIRSLDPVATATFSSVETDDFPRPLSSRATALWLVCMRSASCCWVRPARVRASMTWLAILVRRGVGGAELRVVAPASDSGLHWDGLVHSFAVIACCTTTVVPAKRSVTLACKV